MTKWAMMSDFGIRLPDRPGELARLGQSLREAEVNRVGLWGYGEGRDKARFYCVPERGEQFREFARSEGLDVEEGKTFYLTGADHPGAMVEWLEKIAKAEINLHAINAVRIGDEFGGFIWADQKDWETLARLLM